FILVYLGFLRILRDGESRDQSENALREAQRLAHIGSFSFDITSRILYCSEECLRIAGIPGDQFTGAPEQIYERIGREDSLRLMAECRRVIRLCKDTEFTMRLTREPNEERMVSFRLMPVVGGADKATKLLGTVQDITEQKRAEAAALESQSIYKALISSSCDLVYVKDDQLRYIALNQRMVDYYGIRSEKMAIGRRVYEMLQTESALKWEERDRLVVTSGQAMTVEETVGSETYETIIFPVTLANKKTGVGGISRIITQRFLAELAVEQERDRAEMYLNLSPIVFVALDLQGRVTMINRAGCEILGASRKDILGQHWVDRNVPKEAQPETEDILSAFERSDNAGYLTHENAILTLRGERRDIEWKNVLMRDDQGTVTGLLGAGIDITELKRTMSALRESERSKSVLLSNLQGVAFRCLFDRKWTMQFVSQGCFALTGYQPEDLINNKTISFDDIICEEYRDYIWRESTRALEEHRSCRYEYEILTASGERKWVLEINQVVYDDAGTVEAMEGIIIDITESKKQFLQIQYLSDHDQLTGLFNRMYYETAKNTLDRERQFPLTILLADINGLRLINDAFGYDAGDRMIKQTAEILKSCCREGDILARIGGDEFALLLPNADPGEAYAVMLVIHKAFEEYNEALPDKAKVINLSIGSSTKCSDIVSIKEIEKDADANMSRRKLFDQKSHHNAVLSSITATMYERSYETEAHAERIAHLCAMTGASMGLTHEEIDKLHLFSMLHDIGKIGISDYILKKAGKLTDEEWEEMRKHPEIGYRIAMSSQDFANVADYILTHHERWDGNGYPRGLAGVDIPVLSRILAVADSYDAMTEDRVYHKAITHGEAMEEIMRCSGTQFDPKVVEVFLREMQKRT
ncbi:MAG: PAS domain S-box protein, partial [Clostridiaceae bacterium]